eukprot:tig00001160_g7347.t1
MPRAASSSAASFTPPSVRAPRISPRRSAPPRAGPLALLQLPAPAQEPLQLALLQLQLLRAREGRRAERRGAGGTGAAAGLGVLGRCGAPRCPPRLVRALPRPAAHGELVSPAGAPPRPPRPAAGAASGAGRGGRGNERGGVAPAALDLLGRGGAPRRLLPPPPRPAALRELVSPAPPRPAPPGAQRRAGAAAAGGGGALPAARAERLVRLELRRLAPALRALDRSSSTRGSRGATWGPLPPRPAPRLRSPAARVMALELAPAAPRSRPRRLVPLGLEARRRPPLRPAPR